MKKIHLTRDKFALVDDADYKWLKKWQWFAHKEHHTLYAIRNIQIGKKQQRTERMHRVILGLHQGDKQVTDHRDGNGLNNQRSNLRACTKIQNAQSSRKWKVGTSKYKGVDWYRRDSKWRSRIDVKNKQVFLGHFDSEIDAAIAYNAASLKHFGKFALLNAL